MPSRKRRSASFATADEGSGLGADIEMDIDEVEGFLDELQDDQGDSEDKTEIPDSQATRRLEHVLVIPPHDDFDRDAYNIISGNRVEKILQEDDEGDEPQYKIRFGDNRIDTVSCTSVSRQRAYFIRPCVTQ